eukprot:94327-Alexandrium_andersonii.AAC.1
MLLKSVATVSGLRLPSIAPRLGGGVGSGTEGGWLEAAPEPVASGPWLGRGPCPSPAAAVPGGPSQLQSAAPRLQTRHRAAVGRKRRPRSQQG